MTCPTPERRGQFGLRRMLAVMTLLAVPLAALRVWGGADACCLSAVLLIALPYVLEKASRERLTPPEYGRLLVVGTIVGGCMGMLMSTPTLLSPPTMPWHVCVPLGGLLGLVSGLAIAAILRDRP